MKIFRSIYIYESIKKKFLDRNASLTGSFEWSLTLLIFPQKCGEDSEPFEDWTLRWRICELMISILSDVAQIR